jgi:hypothetical protein
LLDGTKGRSFRKDGIRPHPNAALSCLPQCARTTTSADFTGAGCEEILVGADHNRWAEGLRTVNTLTDLIQATQDQLEQSDGVRPDRILLYLDQGEDARRFSEVIGEGLKGSPSRRLCEAQGGIFRPLAGGHPTFFGARPR